MSILTIDTLKIGDLVTLAHDDPGRKVGNISRGPQGLTRVAFTDGTFGLFPPHAQFTETGINVALRKGFHKMTAADMGRECRAMLDACPTCNFAGLEPGKTYIYKPSSGSMKLLTIGEVTPKRTQAVANIDGNTRRVYKGDFTGTFCELDTDLRALTGITHEMIVKAAVDAGLDVPPAVRREYPALFVEIPERFAQPNTTATERVTNALSNTWFKREPVTPATLDAQIEEAHRQIAKLQDTRCQAVVANPDVGPDYDRYLEGHRNDIDFYRWLRRLVDVGEVFHIPA
jgi:hypothetical protein